MGRTTAAGSALPESAVGATSRFVRPRHSRFIADKWDVILMAVRWLLASPALRDERRGAAQRARHRCVRTVLRWVQRSGRCWRPKAVSTVGRSVAVVSGRYVLPPRQGQVVPALRWVERSGRWRPKPVTRASLHHFRRGVLRAGARPVRPGTEYDDHRSSRPRAWRSET